MKRNLISYFIYCLSVLFILICACNYTIALEDRKWGDVADEFMTMTVFPDDTSAAALKIFDIARIHIVRESYFGMYFERHFQIKILKSSGISQGDIAIRYWYKDKITELKAHTILPNGKKKKLNKKNIFDEEYKEHIRVKKFSLPAVEVGSVIEVKYKLWSKSLYNLEPWVFHSDIPTIESVLSLKMAPGFIYSTLIKNDFLGKVILEQEPYIEHKYPGMSLTEFIYRAENLSAIKKEPYISSLSNYKARLDFQIKRYKYNSVNLTFIKDLSTLCKELLDWKFGTYLKPTGKVKDLVKLLINEQDPDIIKTKKIFEYVRDQFDDELYYGTIHPKKEQNDILDKKKASDSERNLLLVSMLRAAGLNAKPVLISTVDHGWADPEFPFLDQYNRTIVLVYMNQKLQLCDASSRFVPFGMIPSNSLGQIGLEVSKNGHKLIKIPNSGIKSKENVDISASVTPDGVIKGTFNIESCGYACQHRNYQLDTESGVKDFITEKLCDNWDDFEIIQADTMLTAMPADTFTTSFTFESSGQLEIVDNEIYLKPVLFFARDKNVFVSEKREFPLEFAYRSLTIERNSFEFPEGSTIVEIPDNVKINSKYIRYSRYINVSTEVPLKITCRRHFKVNTLSVPGSYYQEIKRDFARIVDADQQQVIVKLKSE